VQPPITSAAASTPALVFRKRRITLPEGLISAHPTYGRRYSGGQIAPRVMVNLVSKDCVVPAASSKAPEATHRYR
jgi:hypothetical protein